MRKLFFAGALLVPVDVGAEETSSRLVLDLGTVIGSEAGCQLAYDQTAIERYIAVNVPADDMSFMERINTIIRVTARDFDRFTQSQKTAHCAQVQRVAAANGFIE